MSVASLFELQVFLGRSFHLTGKNKEKLIHGTRQLYRLCGRIHNIYDIYCSKVVFRLRCISITVKW